MSKEIRIGIVGNVDSGKSTFIGVYKNNKYDDGKGSARKDVLQCQHEKDSGRTSTVSQQYIKINNKCDKSLVFVDLAGHEKYLKTTLHGLTGYNIDHVFVLIGANMGVTRMTREHLSVVLSLNISFSIIITKTDIAPKSVYEKTLKSVIKMINVMSKRRKLINKSKIINKKEEIDIKENTILIFSISNKTGYNYELVKEFINIYIKNYKYKKYDFDCTKLFMIDRKYSVLNIGTVISGRSLIGEFTKGEKLFIGPFRNEWYEIVLKSFHDNFRNTINKIKENEAGTIAIKYTNLKKDLIKNLVYNKSLYIITKDDLKKLHYQSFDAKVKILINHSTTIKRIMSQ